VPGVRVSVAGPICTAGHTLFPVSTSDGADRRFRHLEALNFCRLVNTGAMFTRLPTSVKELRGTLRPCRVNRDHPNGLGESPTYRAKDERRYGARRSGSPCRRLFPPPEYQGDRLATCSPSARVCLTCHAVK
jgi:hypothetical protein